MSKLLILGAGQYGFVAKEVAESMGCFSQIDFLDDRSDIAIGKLDDIEKIEYDVAVVAIGNPVVRSKLLAKVEKPITLVHPHAMVSKTATVDIGCIVEAMAVVCSNATVGKGCLVMSGAVVGHDSKVGDYCQLKYNCVISERETVPDMSKVDDCVAYHSTTTPNEYMEWIKSKENEEVQT